MIFWDLKNEDLAWAGAAAVGAAVVEAGEEAGVEDEATTAGSSSPMSEPHSMMSMTARNAELRSGIIIIPRKPSAEGPLVSIRVTSGARFSTRVKASRSEAWRSSTHKE